MLRRNAEQFERLGPLASYRPPISDRALEGILRASAALLDVASAIIASANRADIARRDDERR